MTEAENAGQFIRRRGVSFAETEGKKSRRGVGYQRDVKNEGTSGDVYENKGQHDNVPGTKTPFVLG